MKEKLPDEPRDATVVSIREHAAGTAGQAGAAGDRARSYLRRTEAGEPVASSESAEVQLEKLTETVREFQTLFPQVMGMISVAPQGELDTETVAAIQSLREKALFIFEHSSVTTADLEHMITVLNEELFRKFGVIFPVREGE